jgi:hypothetical protein
MAPAPVILSLAQKQDSKIIMKNLAKCSALANRMLWFIIFNKLFF